MDFKEFAMEERNHHHWIFTTWQNIKYNRNTVCYISYVTQEVIFHVSLESWDNVILYFVMKLTFKCLCGSWCVTFSRHNSLWITKLISSFNIKASRRKRNMLAQTIRSPNVLLKIKLNRPHLITMSHTTHYCTWVSSTNGLHLSKSMS